MAVTCETKLRSGATCGVIAVGRCLNCESAWCDTHRGACTCATRPAATSTTPAAVQTGEYPSFAQIMARRNQTPQRSPADALRAEAERIAASRDQVAREQRFIDEWGRSPIGIESVLRDETSGLIEAYRASGGRFDTRVHLVTGPHGHPVGFIGDPMTDDDIERATSHGPWPSSASKREREKMNRQRARAAMERRDSYNRRVRSLGTVVGAVVLSVSDGEGGSKTAWCLEDGRIGGPRLPVATSDRVTDVRPEEIRAALARRLAG